MRETTESCVGFSLQMTATPRPTEPTCSWKLSNAGNCSTKDWWQHPGWNYAVAFADLYLPHLRKTLRSSVFKGDLLDDGMPISDLKHRLIPARDESVNWQTMYAVYFSNLKQSDVETLHRELSNDERYRGYIDVSLANPVRDYLARCLPSTWVLHDKTVLLTHGADEPVKPLGVV